MFNIDAPKMGIKAGDGFLFETCLPEGSVQVSSLERREGGQQALHGSGEPDSVEVLFNFAGNGVYSSHGHAQDRLAYSDDLWKLDATVRLHETATDAVLEARIAFDCSTP
jgi:hypothetical protein